MAQKMGRHQIILDEARLNENPVARLSRLIQYQFWDSLTRRIDKDMIDIIAVDPKNRGPDSRPRIYVPYSEKEQYEYYTKISKERPDLKLDVVYLPEKITPEWVKNINETPGLLALDMEKSTDQDGNVSLKGVPYVVPGGRFNEFYGWDSYMIALGLLVNDRVDLAMGMVKNFVYEIKHYGKILNANRSYYLCRSQPPFLTDMALRVYKQIKGTPGAKDFLKNAMYAAIKEYNTVWTSEPRLDPITGLSRYRPDGLGIPPETESSHFEHLLLPYTKKYNLSFKEFTEKYNDGIIKEPDLDIYFLHDRAVRESGHDTSYRLEGRCADMATIDLNSLLYKYESDIGATIRDEFSDQLEMPDGTIESSAKWESFKNKRKNACDKYLWNEQRGIYFDYDTRLKQQSDYESCTTFWALYAGLATPEQAASLVKNAIPLFEEPGGLVAGTRKSRGEVGIDRPNRQWDYPYGWAPQQILAWIGLLRYGYNKEALRLIYKWLYMMTKAFVDFNGTVVEKYDVTHSSHPHLVDAEYGNQGGDFKGVATEGFGWVNASYVLGLSLINSKANRALGTLTTPEIFIKSEEDEEKEKEKDLE